MSAADLPLPPPLCPGNPGQGTEGTVGFATAHKNWEETFDLLALLAEMLRAGGYQVKQEAAWLLLPDSGYILQPQWVYCRVLPDGQVQTTTTLQVNHPRLAPDGLFEYQHALGSSLTEALWRGLEQWMQTDLVPLLEVLQPQPKHCMRLELTLPASQGRPARRRRVILGPVLHFRQQPPQPAVPSEEEDHPFCPCCLFTRTMLAFRPWLESEGLYGLRLVAIRDAEGRPQADCRINGADWEDGAQALREYALTWPLAGYEMRKQYVVLHTVEEAL